MDIYDQSLRDVHVNQKKLVIFFKLVNEKLIIFELALLT